MSNSELVTLSVTLTDNEDNAPNSNCLEIRNVLVAQNRQETNDEKKKETQ